MHLANMLITHGSELCTAKGPDDVRKLNAKIAKEARKFLSQVEEPKEKKNPDIVKEV